MTGMLPTLQPIVVSKTELMKHVALGLAHESFHHDEYGDFDTTLMRLHAVRTKKPIEFVPLAALIPFLTQAIANNERDVDMARVDELTLAQLDDPGIAIALPDGTHMLTDGHHRAMRAHKEGRELMPFWLFDLKDAIRPPRGFVPNRHEWGKAITPDGKLKNRS